jgi:hypothetical protein
MVVNRGNSRRIVDELRARKEERKTRIALERPMILANDLLIRIGHNLPQNCLIEEGPRSGICPSFQCNRDVKNC